MASWWNKYRLKLCIAKHTFSGLLVIKLLLSRGMPVSKFTLKYSNKMIWNVDSLSKYSPKLFGARCYARQEQWGGAAECLSASQELLGNGIGEWQIHSMFQNRDWPLGASQVVFIQEMDEWMNRGMNREKTRAPQCYRAGPEVMWGDVGA